MDLSLNIVAAMVTALGFSVSTPPDLFSCSAALDSSPLAVFNCVRVLQASKPSYHLCSTLLLSALPQFPNQEPPRPQQLLLPDLPMMPHLGHTGTMAVSLAAVVYICEDQSRKINKAFIGCYLIVYLHFIGTELTFAGLHAFRPLVINIIAA